MGYDVHITRAETWLDSATHPIALSEWLRYVDADPEMRLDGYAEVANPQGEVLSYESEGLAVWTAWSRHGVDDGMAWFDYGDGMIIVKNPDPEILAKMKRIAAVLKAHVIGDEEERY